MEQNEYLKQKKNKARKDYMKKYRETNPYSVLKWRINDVIKQAEKINYDNPYIENLRKVIQDIEREVAR